MLLLTQLQLLCTTANATSSHITPAIANATANDEFQSGTTGSTTATAAHKSTATATASAIGDFRPGTTASTAANDGFKQLQLQGQMVM